MERFIDTIRDILWTLTIYTARIGGIVIGLGCLVAILMIILDYFISGGTI